MVAESFLLAIDTTGSRLNLGIDNFAGIQRYCSLPLGRALSTDMHEQLRNFILPQTWPDIGCICVAQGPGSYTGSRIGVVTARTLAASLKVPLYGVSSLAIAALISATEPGRWAIDIAAQKRHVYGGIYDILSEVDEPKVVDLPGNIKETEWVERLVELEKTAGTALQRVSFVYDEETSIELLKQMLGIAHRSFKEHISGSWQAVLPIYG